MSSTFASRLARIVVSRLRRIRIWSNNRLRRKSSDIAHVSRWPRERIADIGLIDDYHRRGSDYRVDHGRRFYSTISSNDPRYFRDTSRAPSPRGAASLVTQIQFVTLIAREEKKKGLSGDDRRARVAGERGNGYRSREGGRGVSERRLTPARRRH